MTLFARGRTGAKGMEKFIEIVKDRSKGGKLHAAINYFDEPASRRAKEALTVAISMRRASRY